MYLHIRVYVNLTLFRWCDITNSRTLNLSLLGVKSLGAGACAGDGGEGAGGGGGGGLGDWVRGVSSGDL